MAAVYINVFRVSWFRRKLMPLYVVAIFSCACVHIELIDVTVRLLTFIREVPSSGLSWIFDILTDGFSLFYSSTPDMPRWRFDLATTTSKYFPNQLSTPRKSIIKITPDEL